jgi:anaerobic selenocysteine-containing dehydrogenase
MPGVALHVLHSSGNQWRDDARAGRSAGLIQFTSSVYSYDDSYRGIKGSREVLLMNRDDMQRLGIGEGDALRVSTAASDGHERSLTLSAPGFDIPMGCAAGYYPECNRLIPLWHHAQESMVPAAKFIPIRVAKVGVTLRG